MVKVKNWEENINTWMSEIHVMHKMAVSVDSVVFGYSGKDLYVLLMMCNMPPYEGKYSLVGDLVHSKESMSEAVARILDEKAKLSDLHFEEVGVFSKVDRHPMGRVITVAYLALLNIDKYIIEDAENRDLLWLPFNEVKELELAFDHGDILKESYKVLQKSLINESISFKLLPEKFTIKELQRLFEMILNIKLDKRNFRRKLNDLDILVELDDIQKGVNHRPAKLYSFNKNIQSRNLNIIPNFEH